MEGTFSQQDIQANTKEVQDIMSKMMSEAIKVLPRPKLPPWLEASVDFIKLHPWISLGILVFILFIISFIVREMLCSYFKIDEIIRRLKKIEDKVKGL